MPEKKKHRAGGAKSSRKSTPAAIQVVKSDPPASAQILESNVTTVEPIEATVSRQVIELHRRRLGYAFGGPNIAWCEPSEPRLQSAHGMRLPINPESEGGPHSLYTGCRKYAECDLIPDAIRWRAWDELTNEEKDVLRKTNCYRATRVSWDPVNETSIESTRSSWDSQALPSRKRDVPNAHWIGNPFGVRTSGLGEIVWKAQKKGVDLSLHRDLSPCPVGGCVTPEMQRDYLWEKQGMTENQENSVSSSLSSTPGKSLSHWANIQACPFFSRHTNESFTEATPNAQRFAQCYVTLPEVRQTFAQAGVVAAAPIFRSSSRTETNGEAYWYSFYSGFSFIQLLTRKPIDPGWDDLPFVSRWQATTISRQQITKATTRSPIQKLFDSVETGGRNVPWEQEERLISISDGMASALLLQWILIRRLLAELETKKRSVNIFDKLLWQYEFSVPNETSTLASLGVVHKLHSYGYDLSHEFEIGHDPQKQVNRRSSLTEDLQLLGLIDTNGRPTKRLDCCFAWLRARVKGSLQGEPQESTRHKIKEWLMPGENTILSLPELGEKVDQGSIAKLCWSLLEAAAKNYITPVSKHSFATLRHVSITDSEALITYLKEEFEEKIFRTVCSLVPQVHILVRAYGTSPVRWLFIPMGEDTARDRGGDTPLLRVHSGLILLLEDDITSISYACDPGYSLTDDNVLNRLRIIRPLLTRVSRIEEANVREELINAKDWSDEQNKNAASLGHRVRTIKRFLLRRQDAPIKAIHYLLNSLESQFRIAPEIGKGLSMHESIELDIVATAQLSIDTVKALLAYVIPKESQSIEIEFESKWDDCTALINPIMARYEELDSPEDVKVRTRDDFISFFNDLILQRVSAGEEKIIVRVQPVTDETRSKQQIAIEIITGELPPQLIWKYPGKTIEERWPIGRGFYSIFSSAKNLGAVEQEITNFTDDANRKLGKIRIVFERAP